MPYNPFEKSIYEPLTKEDVYKLIEYKVAEGYYIEYKGEVFPKNEKIARSIASFANTYGGWYIVGVKTDEHNVANEICGFDIGEFNDPISKVREIIKSHLDPVPVFYIQVVKLADERAVLIAFIPENQKTPFVSKDGRIYRRIGDSSDPIPENKSHIVDQLVKDGRRKVRKFIKFCKDEREFSQTEDSGGWVNIFFSPYPEGLVNWDDINSSSRIKAILKQSQEPVEMYVGEIGLMKGCIPFNVGLPSIVSSIFQQLDINRVAQNTLQVEFYVDGRAKFHIPIEYINLFQQEAASRVKSSRIRKFLKERVSIEESKVNYSCLRFFDFPKLWSAIVTLLALYHHLLGNEHVIADVQVAIRLTGVWRSVPFVDSDEWMDFVQDFGLPVLRQPKLTIPQDLNNQVLLSLGDKKEFWEVLCEILSNAFGVPAEIMLLAVKQCISTSISSQESSIGK